MKTDRLTRREFIRGAAGLALAGAAGGLSRGSDSAGNGERPVAGGTAHGRDHGVESPRAPAGGRPRVVLVRDEKSLADDGRPDAAVLARMIDDAVVALVGAAGASAAWSHLIRPDDTVGIKSNVWRFLPTPRGIEEAIRRRVTGAGVAAERVAVDDRGVLRNPVFEDATALINVRPMRTHHWAGVGSLLKNYIMFASNPPEWHDDSCADLAGLWDLPAVRGKTRLNILVMLTPLFHSVGPHDFDRRYTWPYRGILAGLDPVATDAIGLSILQARRREHFGSERPFEVPPKHIRVAEESFGLGVSDPSRIDLVRFGWSEGILI